MSPYTGELDPASEAGFSLVEVIVAMVLLAVVALLTVPFFALSLRQTGTTSSQTSATGQVSAVLEQAHATPTCANLTALPQTTGTDAQGRAFGIAVVVSTCRAAALVSVTATATRVSDGVVLASAATKVYVP
jgi:prepilin-type N-terminal cleavage/methylation domain-containing protein